MNAIKLLETQHRHVEALFRQFEKAPNAFLKSKIFDRIASSLVAHDAIEREIFYPACEAALGKEEDILGESLVEHGLAEFSIFRADLNRETDDFEKYVTVLEEVIEHHVEEEEEDLFPKVRRALGARKLEALGLRMEARFAEAIATDFRASLRANLQQVLAGRTKTAKKPPPKVRRAAPTARTRSRGTKSATGRRPRPRV
jgi:hemerythrin superfamily protein